MAGGPPAGADPVHTWLRCTELPRPSGEPTELVARGHTIGLARFWVLGDVEIAAIGAQAQRDYPGGADRLARYAGVLAASARAAADISRPFFASVDDAGELTEDEIMLALAGYVAVRKQLPRLSETTKPQMDAWIRVLAEGASRLPMAAMQWGKDDVSDVRGVDATYGVLDCHFLAWCAAQRVLHPEPKKKQQAPRR